MSDVSSINRNEFHKTLENNEKYSKDIQQLKSTIITYHDFPKPGITYKYKIVYLKLYEKEELMN